MVHFLADMTMSQFLLAGLSIYFQFQKITTKANNEQGIDVCVDGLRFNAGVGGPIVLLVSHLLRTEASDQVNFTIHLRYTTLGITGCNNNYVMFQHEESFSYYITVRVW